MLEELAVLVSISLRRFDLRRRLEVEDPLVASGIRVEPPCGPDRQDEVVAGAVSKRPEDRVADARSLVDEEHLVGNPVPIELAIGHRLSRSNDPEDDVAVEVER